jgi:hypothetical protein
VQRRTEPHVGYRLLRGAYPLLRLIVPGLTVRSDIVGQAMVDVLLRRQRTRANIVLENRDIRALVRQQE